MLVLRGEHIYLVYYLLQRCNYEERAFTFGSSFLAINIRATICIVTNFHGMPLAASMLMCFLRASRSLCHPYGTYFRTSHIRPNMSMSIVIGHPRHSGGHSLIFPQHRHAMSSIYCVRIFGSELSIFILCLSCAKIMSDIRWETLERIGLSLERMDIHGFKRAVPVSH